MMNFGIMEHKSPKATIGMKKGLKGITFGPFDLEILLHNEDPRID